jgi:hypothetical protein
MFWHGNQGILVEDFEVGQHSVLNCARLLGEDIRRDPSGEPSWQCVAEHFVSQLDARNALSNSQYFSSSIGQWTRPRRNLTRP